jgi:hypothetical protein
LKKREEALKDPNNPLYKLKSQYYSNNYHASDDPENNP